MTNDTHLIGIDCRLSGNTHAGIGRYIENLVLHLPYENENLRWKLYFYDSQQLTPELEHLFEGNSRVQVSFVPIKHYSLQEQIKLGSIYNQDNLDLLHIPHFNAPITLNKQPKLVITIHDLLWHEQRGLDVTTLPSWKYWAKYLGYKVVTSKAVHRADTILVPSKHVMNTVAHHYPKLQTPVAVTYEGIDERLRTSSEAYKNHSKKLLYVGSLYPHKNLTIVLQALRNLPDFTLEVAGSRSVFMDRLVKEAKKFQVEDQLNLLGYVPDKELGEKYHQAFALLQPSLSEGFGLTGLEAMASGGIVIASDIAVFREIYQSGAAFFDPHDPNSLVKIIQDLAAQKKRTALITQAQLVSQQYSWKEMTSKTVQTYLSLLKQDT